MTLRRTCGAWGVALASFVGAWAYPQRAEAQAGCPCDWNHSGSLSVQDLFDFLASYFAGAGDFNCSGLVSTQDIFDFLACYFAGCANYRGDANPNAPTEQEPAATAAISCAATGMMPRPPRGVENVQLFSGEVIESATDMRIAGRGFDFVWARRYRSQLGASTAMGNGWDYSYNIYLERCVPNVKVHDGWARSDTYTPSGVGLWTAAGIFRELALNPDGTYTLNFADKGKWNFRSFTPPGGVAPGRLSSIVDRNGNTMSFSYDAGGRLVSVLDTLGRTVTIGYTGDGHIQSVTDFTGRSVVYDYYAPAQAGGGPGDLKSARSPLVLTGPATFPAGKTTVYTYTTGLSPEERNHNLLTITDPRGNTYLRAAYHGTGARADFNFDRAVAVTLGNVGETSTIDYSTLVPGPGNNNASVLARVVDRDAHTHEYYYDLQNRCVMSRVYTVGLHAGEPAYYETRWAYNGDGLVTRLDRPRGNFTVWTYDSGNPSARARGNMLSRTNDTNGLGSGGAPPSVTETWQYLTDFGGCCGTNFVTMHVDANGGVTTHSYDAAGNRVHTTHRIPSIVEDWEYNLFGQETKHIHAAGDGGCRRVDVSAYYGAGPQMGYLQSVTRDSGAAPACPGGHFNLTTSYHYDARGNIVRKTDPRGNAADYTINEVDQVVAELSRPASGGVRYLTQYSYDANGNLVRKDVENRDENGVVSPGNAAFETIVDYEILNLPVRETRELAGGGGTNLSPSVLSYAAIPPVQLPEFLVVSEYLYDANRNRVLWRKGAAVSGSDPFNTVQTMYDERDLPYRTVRAPGAVGPGGQSTTHRDYDGNGNVPIEIVALELVSVNPISSSFDGYDRLVLRTDEMGNSTTWTYDGNGNRTGARLNGELTDVPGGAGNVRLRELFYFYDAMDRPIRTEESFFDTPTQAVIGDGLVTTTWVYNDNSTVRSVTDDNVHTSTYAYDTMERRLVETDAGGNTVAHTYDGNDNAVGRVQTHVSTGGNPSQVFNTSYAYDGLDRMIQRTDNIGGARSYQYDSRGNRVVDTDELLHRTRYSYDGLNRLVRTVRDMDATGPDGTAPDIDVRVQWDASSRKTAQTDDKGSTTQYSYDSLDRLVRTQFADTTLLLESFDQRGNKKTEDDGNGTHTDYSYDGLDRVIQKSVLPGAGLAPAPPPDTNGGTLLETYQYDGLSRLVRATDDDSQVTRSYDSRGHVTRETQQLLRPAAPVRTVIAVYDGVGNQTRLTYPGGRVVTRSYDALDRTLSVADAAPAFSLATYKYIGPSRIERRDFGNLTRSDYSYDGLARLVRTLHTDTVSLATIDDRTVSYDAAGNKTSWLETSVNPPALRTYAYDAANRLVQSIGPSYWPTTTYTLDGTGNRTSVIGGNDQGNYSCDSTLPAPADCEMNRYTSTAFDSRTYDGNGNLAAATGQPAGISRAMMYDYRNRLVQFVDVATGATSVYKYDCLGRRVQKSVGGVVSRHYYDGQEEIEEQSSANTTVATYVHSKNSRCVISSTRGTARFYYHDDDQDSIVKVTNAARQVTNLTEYGDYGRPFTPNGPQAGDLVYSIDADRDPSPTGEMQEVADDFWLPASNGPLVLQGLTFRGGYDYSVPLLGPDQFEIRIYETDPGTGFPLNPIMDVFLSGSQVVRNPTGRVLCCNEHPGSQEFQYQCTLPSPVTLQPNTRYWLWIQNATFGDPSTFGWETSDDGNGRACTRANVSAPWVRVSFDFTFSLTVSGLAASSNNPFAYNGRRYDPETGYTMFGGRMLDSRAGCYIQDFGDTSVRDIGRWIMAAAEGSAWSTFARVNPTSLETVIYASSWWDPWWVTGAQEEAKKKKCCVEKFEVKWSEPSAAALKQAPSTLVEIQVEITFGTVEPCDPACCEYSQQVMTKYTVKDGPHKGAKSDTSPMHDDNYSRNNKGPNPDDQDGKTDLSDPGFKTSDLPGPRPNGEELDAQDDIDYEFTAAQYVHDTCNGGALVAQRGPHTAHITGKAPRNNNKTLPATLDKDPPKK